jgi:hypothetical protein
VEPAITVWAGFRAHVLLLPHDVVGSIIDNRPTFSGLTEAGGSIFRGSREVLQIDRAERNGKTVVTVTATTDVWLQEPGLTVKVAGDGTWRGFGLRNQWTSPPYPLHQKDAHRSTIHFSRVMFLDRKGKRPNPRYTVGLEYREDGACWRFRSDGGFRKLLDTPADAVPWPDCEVFAEGFPLVGVYLPLWEPLLRWELAAKPPNIAQAHFIGWPGGAGAVVNALGRTPQPGEDVTASSGFDRLHRPDSWRCLRAGQSISQTVSMRRLAA